MRTHYFQPIVRSDPTRPAGVSYLTGSRLWFEQALMLSRDAAPCVVDHKQIPRECLSCLTASRAPIAGISFDQPRIMGVVNITPDSFSDGGCFIKPGKAVAAARQMRADGADIIDIGAESTRPGADPVSTDRQIARVAPVLQHLAGEGGYVISLDTRDAKVAKSALKQGFSIVNDVSGFTHDPAMAPLCTAHKLAVCVMHSQGDPGTMQQNPTYGHVLLDVYDALEARVDMLAGIGIDRSRIVVDPGIGFGKTVEHNLALMRGLALFHGLGCVLLLGASRKAFIGKITGVPIARERLPGSLVAALAAVEQGAQIIRVHDVAATHQALAFQRSIKGH